MALQGLHHVTAITGDAQANLDFYRGLLGLRLVKKTVNFDQPDVYHLYYGDEHGTPGSILTFFEFPGAKPGRHGEGMVHTIGWRVGSDAALGFWADRLGAAGGPAGGGRRAAAAPPPRARGARRRSATARRGASPTRRACATSGARPPTCATRRSPRRRPACRPSTHCSASTACARTRRRPSAARGCSRRSGSSGR